MANIVRTHLIVTRVLAGLVWVAGPLTVWSSAQVGLDTWGGVYSAAQARQGEQAYSSACASCHGADLAGGEMAPSLLGGEFSSNWNDLTLADLFDRIYQTMPQNAPRSLSRETDADITAYLLKRNGFPEGTAPLPADQATLRSIRFKAQKPE